MVSLGEPSRKRARVEAPDAGFADADNLRQALQTSDPEELAHVLLRLRNQLTVKAHEEPIAPSDERLAFVQSYLDSPLTRDAKQLFDIWSAASPKQPRLLAAVVSTLAALVTILSPHYTFHALGQPVVKTLLSGRWAHSLNTYLSSSSNELVIAALKCFLAVSGFAGGQEQRALMDTFAWESKSLSKLLTMRRRSKSKTARAPNPLTSPDIRTLYIFLLLSLLSPTTLPPVKLALLTQHKEQFAALFKGIHQDPPALVARVLEVCWTGLWGDARVPRTAKVGVFGEATLHHITKLYERGQVEDGAEHAPAELAHHFLLALCTRPGTGVCFHDRGLYPREATADGAAAQEGAEEGEGVPEGSKTGGKGTVHNRILAHLLRNIKPLDDPLQRALSLRILSACPELVAGYAWPALEPRLSSRWLVNAAFLGAVVALPVPAACFLLPARDALAGDAPQYNPVPPPLSALLAATFPTAQLKAHLSKGLQAPAPLVQHASALALVKCLNKYTEVQRALRSVSEKLGEDEDEGAWARRAREFADGARRRVPEFALIVGFAQGLEKGDAGAGKGKERAGTVAMEDDGADAPPPAAANPARDALLGEAAARLLWLYHHALPQLTAETRFDAGKLVSRLVPVEADADAGAGAGGLAVLTQLHTLRLLHAMDGFVWTGKTGGRTHLYTLLALYTTSGVPALRAAVRALVGKLLGESALFQHDARRGEDEREAPAWLDALPARGRAAGAVALDGTPLADERTAVLLFLDDCVQRCSKTPYKYADDLAALLGGSDEEQAELGPLMATLVEQLRIKIAHGLLPPSDVLALAAFARRLLFALAGRGRSLRVLGAVGAHVRSALGGAADNALSGAIRREGELMARCAELIGGRWDGEEDEAMGEDERQTAAVRQFLDSVEQLPPDMVDGRELVDWFRLLDAPLHTEDFARVVLLVSASGAVAQELWDYVPLERSPLRDTQLWTTLGPAAHTVPFPTLLLHATSEQLQDASYRDRMVAAALRSGADGSTEALHLVCHRLANRKADDLDATHLLSVLTGISASLPQDARDAWKARLFGADALQALLAEPLPPHICEVLSQLLRANLDPRSTADMELVAPFTAACVARGAADSMTLVLAPYLRAEDTCAVLRTLTKTPATDASRTSLVALVKTLRRALDAGDAAAVDALEDLFTLYARYPDVGSLEEVIASALAVCLPLGLDGTPEDVEAFDTMGAAAAAAEKRWARRPNGHGWVQRAEQFLQRDGAQWSEDTVAILARMAYLEQGARDAVGRFLVAPQAGEIDVAHLATLVHAWLDGDATGEIVAADPIHFAHFKRLLAAGATTALELMVKRLPTLHAEFSQAVIAHLGTVSKKKCATGLARLGDFWYGLAPGAAGDAGAAIFDHGLRWAAHMLTASRPLDVAELSALERLGMRVPVKSHLLDVVLEAVVQNRMRHTSALDFARKLLPRAQMKPVLVNRHLQSIVQHAEFYRHVSPSSSSRHSLVHLLHVLFHLHPTNTCQPSHIQPLIPAYTGTQSNADSRIFDIFKLYESTRKISVAPLFSRWSPENTTVDTAMQALLGLDANQVFRTCLSLPVRSKTVSTPHDEDVRTLAAQTVYEPAFVLSLLAQALAGEQPKNPLEWVAFFRTNTVSLAIACLSAEDSDLRGLAVSCLASLHVLADVANMQEGPQAKYILDLLKDIVKQESSSGDFLRIPAFATLLLAHALRAVFYPASFVYPLTSRFLLQRPEVDTADVPMLYSMLYSSADEWKRERVWMLKFLADAMLGAGAAEWDIFRRRRTWDLLASLWQSDRAVRPGVLEVLVNLTNGRHIVTSLVLKSGLLAWIEMVLLEQQGELGGLWLCVIENILMVADTAKLEAATNGEWRAALGRCLELLAQQTAFKLSDLVIETRILLRLSQLPGDALPNLSALLSQSLDRLSALESRLALASPVDSTAHVHVVLVDTLHTSLNIQREREDDSIRQWVQAVNMLWRAAMGCTTKSLPWGRLTARLLIWRAAFDHSSDSSIGEWARQQTVFGLVAPCTSTST